MILKILMFYHFKILQVKIKRFYIEDKGYVIHERFLLVPRKIKYRIMYGKRGKEKILSRKLFYGFI